MGMLILLGLFPFKEKRKDPNIDDLILKGHDDSKSIGYIDEVEFHESNYKGCTTATITIRRKDEKQN